MHGASGVEEGVGECGEGACVRVQEAVRRGWPVGADHRGAPSVGDRAVMTPSRVVTSRRDESGVHGGRGSGEECVVARKRINKTTK